MYKADPIAARSRLSELVSQMRSTQHEQKEGASMSETLPPLGIDMAKLSFEAHLRLPAGTTSHGFPNTPEGFEQLEQWLERQGVQRVHACMEATGTSSDGLAHCLHEHGHQVSVVNPARVAAFRKSKGL